MSLARFVWPMILLSGAVSAGETSYARSFRSFSPTTAPKCGLVSYSASAYDTGFVEKTAKDRGTGIATVVETAAPECLKDYAVVQFIRGCVYDIEQNDRTGAIERYYGTVIEGPDGVVRPFKFDDWTVDSVDPDPMYFSAPAKSARDPHRFDTQLYAKRPLRLDGTDAGLTADYATFFDSKWYGFLRDRPEPAQESFTFDFPALSSWYGYPETGRNAVTVASLEFRTCLYPTEGVPLRSAPKGKPIACFDWASRYSFDFATKEFAPAAAIDPFCATPVPPTSRHPTHPARRTEPVSR
jgi:hypothetical protein